MQLPPQARLPLVAGTESTLPSAPTAPTAPAEPALATQAPDPPGEHAAVSATGPAPQQDSANPDVAPWLLQMLDQIDQGLLLVRPNGDLLYANPAARQELDPQHPLQWLGRGLQVPDGTDTAPLLAALADAASGARRLVNLGQGAHSLTVSVVPLSGPRRPDALADLQDLPGILLVLGRRANGPPPGLQHFADSLALTPTETKVLQGLYEGLSPSELGLRMGVAVSTIRTHIGSMRTKAGASSIRELVRLVAVLPPLALDQAPAAAPAQAGPSVGIEHSAAPATVTTAVGTFHPAARQAVRPAARPSAGAAAD